MAKLDPSRLMAYSPARGRKFGFTVGGAFAVIALISLWRSHATAPKVFGAIAAVLVAAALASPRSLEKVEAAWMRLAHLISRVTTPIFMAIVYFVVLTPMGLLRRTLGSNPMVHSDERGTFWIERPAKEKEKERLGMERQF
jgi:hypothetical protein